MKHCPVCGAARLVVRLAARGDKKLLALDGGDGALLGYVIEDRYRLDEVIGKGGFGAVYRAQHTRIPMEVAVKMMHQAGRSDEASVARFKQEVRAVARIRNPHVIEVFDFGYDERAGYFIVMQLLKGQSLWQRLARGALTITEVHEVLKQTVSALDAAHQAGVIHRDVKSENVFLARDSTTATGWSVKLLDFGLASMRLDVGDPAQLATRGCVFGTAASMAPEVVSGGKIDARTDVYSLGVLLFEILSGKGPFLSDDPNELLRQQLHELPPPPSTVGYGEWVPAAVDSLVLAMLAKDPGQRPASVGEVLQRWLAVQPAASEAWAARFVGGEREPIHPPADAKATPAAPGQTESATVEGMSVGNAAQAFAGPLPRILVIDDDEAMRYLVRAVLQVGGWDCVTVDSAPAAIEYLMQNAWPDGIVADVLMPGVRGLDLLTNIRKIGYTGPVVFCSSLTSKAIRAEILASGAGFVNKSEDIQSLTEELLRLGAPRPGSQKRERI